MTDFNVTVQMRSATPQPESSAEIGGVRTSVGVVPGECGIGEQVEAPTLQRNALAEALSRFAPVALADMQHAALMDRCESKYLLPLAALPALLSALSAHYQVLTIDGETLFSYRSLYLDTPAFDFYYAHHNGRARRYKVRFRSYVQSQLTFLEVKERSANGRTVKTRASVPQPAFPLPQQGSALVEQVPTRDQDLEPKLWVNYQRVTLVGIGRPERVTLDFNLEFQRPGSGAAGQRAGQMVIVELKRASQRQSSPLETYVRAHGFRGGSFSKYGVGCSLLYPLRHNAFKPQRLAMQRLTVAHLEVSA